MCNTGREIRPGERSGDGISITEDAFSTYSFSGYWGVDAWGNELWGGENILRDEPVVGSGCPLCGAYTYV